jgi:small subunit ribosomal protein S8
MLNSILADTIARIKNGYKAGLLYIKVLNSKLVKSVLQVLQNEGFIDSFFLSNDNITANGVVKELDVKLRYVDNKPALYSMKLISKPGRKLYIKHEEMKYIVNRFGVRILSTNKGIITDKRARELGIGGEYLLEVN